MSDSWNLLTVDTYPLQRDYCLTKYMLEDDCTECCSSNVYKDTTGHNSCGSCDQFDMPWGTSPCRNQGPSQSREIATKCSKRPDTSFCPILGNGAVTAKDIYYNIVDSNQDDRSGGKSSVPMVCVYDKNELQSSMTANDAGNFPNLFNMTAAKTPSGYQSLDKTSDVYNQIMSTWCSVPSDDGTYRLFDQASCTAWCDKNPDQCNPLKSSYCKGSNLSSPQCMAFCSDVSGPDGSLYNCDGALEDYCQNQLTPGEAVAEPICGCYLPSSFYQNYFGSLTDNIQVALTEDLPQCFFAGCAASKVRPVSMWQNSGKDGKKCPDISNCVKIVNFNNDGSFIKGDVVINISNPECANQVQVNPASCADNEIVSPDGLSCQSCPTSAPYAVENHKFCAPKAKFRCGDSGCESAFDGPYETLEDCQNSDCSAKKKWSCTPYGCSQASYGTYDSKDECELECSGRTVPQWYFYVFFGIVSLYILIVLYNILKK